MAPSRDMNFIVATVPSHCFVSCFRSPPSLLPPPLFRSCSRGLLCGCRLPGSAYARARLCLGILSLLLVLLLLRSPLGLASLRGHSRSSVQPVSHFKSAVLCVGRRSRVGADNLWPGKRPLEGTAESAVRTHPVTKKTTSRSKNKSVAKRAVLASCRLLSQNGYGT